MILQVERSVTTFTHDVPPFLTRYPHSLHAYHRTSSDGLQDYRLPCIVTYILYTSSIFISTVILEMTHLSTCNSSLMDMYLIICLHSIMCNNLRLTIYWMSLFE